MAETASDAIPTVEMRPIPGYPGYSATADGHIWSHRKSRLLSENVNFGGYLTVGIWCTRDGVSKSRTKFVHRLVAAAWVGVPAPGMPVNHADGDKTNNKPN